MSKTIWHPSSEIPPLHEENFVDDGMVFTTMVSDWVHVRDDTCSNSYDDPYAPPVRVSRFVDDGTVSMWDDGTGRKSSVSCWAPLPELQLPDKGQRDDGSQHPSPR